MLISEEMIMVLENRGRESAVLMKFLWVLREVF